MFLKGSSLFFVQAAPVGSFLVRERRSSENDFHFYALDVKSLLKVDHVRLTLLPTFMTNSTTLCECMKGELSQDLCTVEWIWQNLRPGWIFSKPVLFH